MVAVVYSNSSVDDNERPWFRVFGNEDSAIQSLEKSNFKKKSEFEYELVMFNNTVKAAIGEVVNAATQTVSFERFMVTEEYCM